MKALPQTTALLLALLLPGPPVWGEAPAGLAVRDSAELFHAPTRARAAEKIDEIRRVFHRDVVVETVLAVPEADRDAVRVMRHLDQVNYFNALGRRHAEDAALTGIHVLFCRAPRYVEITAWPESEQQTFTANDAERLRKLLKHRRFSSGYDQALLDGLDLVHTTYQRNLHLGNPGDGPARAGTMAAVLAGFLGAWLVLLLVSARLRRQTEDSTMLHPGLLGVLFGHPAALWIYDSLFARDRAARDHGRPTAPQTTDLSYAAPIVEVLYDRPSSEHAPSLPSG